MSSHMRIFRITDDGKNHPGNGDIFSHRQFVGDLGDQDIRVDEGRVFVAKPDAADDDPLAQEIEWGMSALTLPGSCRNRGHEGFDQRVHLKSVT